MNAPGGAARPVPQPHPSRITPFAGHPAVVGVVPGQSPLVALTAAAWAQSQAGAALYFAWAVPELVTVAELPGGAVRTAPRDPDVVDDSWQERAATIRRDLSAALDPLGVPWEYHQLAGRADRALTHLARAVDAAVIVVGARPHGRGRGLRQFFTGSTAVHLAHHQHRPVMVVPVDVVDWQDSSPWQ